MAVTVEPTSNDASWNSRLASSAPSMEHCCEDHGSLDISGYHWCMQSNTQSLVSIFWVWCCWYIYVYYIICISTILSLYRFQTFIPPSHQLSSHLGSAQLISGGTTEGWAGRPLLSCTVYQGTWWTHDEIAKWMEMAICNQEKHHLLLYTFYTHDVPNLLIMFHGVPWFSNSTNQTWVPWGAAERCVKTKSWTLPTLGCWGVSQPMDPFHLRNMMLGSHEILYERERDQPWHVWHAICTSKIKSDLVADKI